MIIALNAIGFGAGRMGGTETYFRDLLHCLQLYDKENIYIILCEQRNLQQFPLFNSHFSLRAVTNVSENSFGGLIRALISRSLSVDILKYLLNGLPVDVIHHPFTILNPLNLSIPSVLTFHDMQHEYYPEFFSALELKRRKEDYRSSTNEANKIIAISSHVKACLIEKYATPPEKIDVVYTGCGDRFQVIKNYAQLEKIRLKYDLKRPFLFYPAATWPHKNHQNLLRALKTLVNRRLFNGQLILTGIAMQAHDRLLHDIDQLGLNETVKLLGYVPSEEMPSLYNLAKAVVWPSLFEGFGIPLLEAMACGCPIACSNVTSIPEIVGDAGAMFDPHSIEDMTEKISLIWNDGKLRKQLKLKGLEQVKFFKWEDMAKKTLAVYKKTASPIL